MKLHKILSSAALFVACSIGMAHAITNPTYNIHITGSTAFRGATMNAIANTLQNPVAVWNGTQSKGITACNYATFSGTIGSNIYHVYVAWSGSEAGIATVSNSTSGGITTAFLSLTGNGTLSGVNKATAPATISGGTYVATSSAVFEQDHADICMSDTWQTSTPFHGTAAGNGSSYATLTGYAVTGIPAATIVGVVPFKWVASKTDQDGNSYVPQTFTMGLSTTSGSTTAVLDSAVTGLKPGVTISGNSNVGFNTSIISIASDNVTCTLSAAATGTGDVSTTFQYYGVSNITDILARRVFESTGGSPGVAAQFTGSSADAATLLIPIGRNHDSGTRETMVLATGIDKAGTPTTLIQQYYPTDANGLFVGNSGAATTITGVELTPTDTVNGLVYTAGKSGYSSGGSVANVFNADNTTLPGVSSGFSDLLFISYLGLSDATNALKGNAQELSYNGIYYSPTAVQNGQYTFWSYEHLYYKTTLSATLKSYAASLASQIANSDATVSGIKIDANFLASRVPVTTDGAIVTR